MLLLKIIFNYFVWLMFFGLLLLGGIIYATDRTYPGDSLYPFKLKFEGFVLATSKILNKQVDFSIDLVVKRSSETAKILSSKYANEGLEQLNTQVELTAVTITQIENPADKKKAAEKYIVKLNEVSSNLSQEQKNLVTTQNQTSTITPSSEISIVSQQVDTTQETIQETIDQMNELKNQSIVQEEAPIPTNIPESNLDNDQEKEKGKNREKNDNNDNKDDRNKNDQERKD